MDLQKNVSRCKLRAPNMRGHNFGRRPVILLNHLGEEETLIHWERVKVVHCASIRRPSNPLHHACKKNTRFFRQGHGGAPATVRARESGREVGPDPSDDGESKVEEARVTRNLV